MAGIIMLRRTGTRRATQIIGGLIIALALIWQALTYFIFDAPFRGRNFVQHDWLTAFDCKEMSDCIEKEQRCIRGQMFSDLRQKLGNGISRPEVEALLGKTDRYETPANCIEYYLGDCSGFKIDGDSMRICFNDQNLVKAVTRHQH